MTALNNWLTRAAVAVVAAIGVGAIAITGCGATSESGESSTKSTVPLFVQVDEVSVAKGTTCWVMSNYHRGEGVFFRAKVFDSATGKTMSKDALQSVVLNLPNSQSMSFSYAGHPGSKPTDAFWGVLWKVPTDYPTGTVEFQVTATANDGRTGQFIDFNVSTSKLTVLE